MVRGNWQKRVESADARRRDAKQRKQRTEDKRQYKTYAAELLQLIDRHGQRPLHIDLWTDCIAADSPPLLDVVDEGNKGSASKRRIRTVSIEDEEMALAGRKGRGRSNSMSEKKKKVHPRSKEVIDTEDREDVPLLCRSHFFTAKCEDASRKKSACRYIHYSAPYKTLAQVLNANKASDHIKQELDFSEEASSLSEDVARASESGAMDMVYHVPIDLTGKDDPQLPLVDELTEALSQRNIPIASLVYATINQTLVFDRSRDGVLVGDREFLFAAVGGDAALGNRRISVGSEGSGSVDERLFDLPGSVLEHMLTFLPDGAVASASQVCRAWHHEIGQNSPNLWRHMLTRRDWPLPTAVSDEGQQVIFRDMFLAHYTALRDVKAMKAALGAISTKRSVKEIEMCYQDFSRRKYAPMEPNCCVSVQVWSPNRILAAYSSDCSLRLFETESKGGGEMICRELVYQRIDPYRNTKRRSCHLVSMGVDEESVGCLCHVSADGIEAEAYILVVMRRDDFLLGESAAADSSRAVSEDAHLNVIDIGEAVLNFLLSSDVVDHRLLYLMDFLADGGEIGEVEVLVSQTMAVCGYGRFMVEVCISIPPLHPEATDDAPMHLLDRKLVLFSANAGAIVWMGDSNDLARPLRPRREDMILSYQRRPNQPGGSRSTCDLLVASSTSPSLMVGAIEASGEVHVTQLIEASDLVRNEIVDEEWTMTTSSHRATVLTASDVVAADVLERVVDNQVLERRSVLSFYPRYPASGASSYTILNVAGDMEAVRLVNLRDSHIVLIARERRSNASGDKVLSICGVVIHVPSRHEIGRMALLDGISEDEADIPVMSVINDGTIGVGLSWKGVVMTGSDCRAVGDSQSIIVDAVGTTPKSAKKKKKGKAKKTSKKDGFARGMSLRG